MVTTADMKSTPVIVISTLFGRRSKKSPPCGLPVKRSGHGPMSKRVCVRRSRIVLSCISAFHSELRHALTPVASSWNSSLTPSRIGIWSYSACRTLPSSLALYTISVWPLMKGPPTARPMKLPVALRETAWIHTSCERTTHRMRSPTKVVWPPSKVMKCGSPKTAQRPTFGRGGFVVVSPQPACITLCAWKKALSTSMSLLRMLASSSQSSHLAPEVQAILPSSSAMNHSSHLPFSAFFMRSAPSQSPSLAPRWLMR
mmetsp:Transcript_39372/g.101884  ORF Transcript_39372/g.101884 Transcript_39372/m.101884 type:complete len:257 (-) Transcript_39372:530-1300(-)